MWITPQPARAKTAAACQKQSRRFATTNLRLQLLPQIGIAFGLELLWAQDGRALGLWLVGLETLRCFVATGPIQMASRPASYWTILGSIQRAKAHLFKSADSAGGHCGDRGAGVRAPSVIDAARRQSGGNSGFVRRH